MMIHSWVPSASNTSDQFKKLIAEPLSGLTLPNNRKLVIIIDGLDECANENDQNEITRLIFDMAHPRNISEPPILWVVCSRTDAEIRRLVTDDLCHRCTLKTLSIEESKEEVAFFIHKKFEEYRSRYSSIAGESRPREDEIKMLCDLSSGLFALAATFFRYLDGKGRRTTSIHVNSILDTLAGKKKDGMRLLWTTNIDSLYTRILEGISEDSIHTTLLILHTLAMTDEGDHLLHSHNIQEFSNTLGLDTTLFYDALIPLESVLDIPHPDQAHEKNLAFLHSSFPDFLHDRTRSTKYGIDERQIKSKIFGHVINILQSDIVLSSLVFPKNTITDKDIDFLIRTHLAWPHEKDEQSRGIAQNVTQSAVRSLLLLLTHEPEWQRKFNFNMFAYLKCAWRFPISLFLAISRTLSRVDEVDRSLLGVIGVTHPDSLPIDHDWVRDPSEKPSSYICLGYAENSVLAVVTSEEEGNDKYGRITFYPTQSSYDIWPHVFERKGLEEDPSNRTAMHVTWKVNLDLSSKAVLEENNDI